MLYGVACGILQCAEMIAAIVKSQRVGTSTLQTPLNNLIHTHIQ